MLDGGSVCWGYLQSLALDDVIRCWPIYIDTTPIQISLFINFLDFEGGLVHSVRNSWYDVSS